MLVGDGLSLDLAARLALALDVELLLVDLLPAPRLGCFGISFAFGFNSLLSATSFGFFGFAVGSTAEVVVTS